MADSALNEIHVGVSPAAKTKQSRTEAPAGIRRRSVLFAAFADASMKGSQARCRARHIRPRRPLVGRLEFNGTCDRGGTDA